MGVMCASFNSFTSKKITYLGLHCASIMDGGTTPQGTRAQEGKNLPNQARLTKLLHEKEVHLYFIQVIVCFGFYAPSA